MKKRILSLALTLILALGLTIPASAHDTDIVKVEAGLNFSLIPTEGGDLYGCGSNNLSQLGDKVTIEYSPIGGYGVFRPEKITSGVTDMAASDHTSSQHRTSSPSGGHSMILKGDKPYTPGDNSCGQLGVGDREKHSGLQYIMDEVVAFDASGSSSAAVTEDGDLYFWGLLMGIGSYTDSQKPKKVLSGVMDVALGADFIVALKEDGTDWTMGDAYRGGLGNGMSEGFSAEFSQVFSGAVAISAGTNHALALTADGKMYAWGSNYSGQFSNGACIYMNLSWLPAGLTASPLPGATPFTDVAKSSYYYEPVL